MSAASTARPRSTTSNSPPTSITAVRLPGSTHPHLWVARRAVCSLLALSARCWRCLLAAGAVCSLLALSARCWRCLLPAGAVCSLLARALLTQRDGGWRRACAAEHLLRLYVKLPELLARCHMQREHMTVLVAKLSELLKFLVTGKAKYFANEYEQPDEEYMRWWAKEGD
jgi:hypothetical protein